MEIKDYISSGVLESVVLGVASEKDTRAAECLRKIYPEVQQEWVEVEQTVEMIAFANAIQPKAELKSSLMDKIRQTSQNESTKEETPVVQLRSTASSSEQKSPSIWKLSAAASIALLIGCSILLFNANRKSALLASQVNEINAENAKKEAVLTALKEDIEHSKSVQAVLTSTATSRILMKGTQMEPDAGVDVMWNSKTQKAVMMAESIAPPPSNMQYQLWAISDGKPVSLGVFNHDELMNITDPFDVALKNISAFAITLEKKGGSEIPHLDKMVVMGAVNA